VRDQLRQIESLAVTAENQLGNLRLNRRRRRVGAKQPFSSMQTAPGEGCLAVLGWAKASPPARRVAAIAVWISALALTARITASAPGLRLFAHPCQ